MLMKVLISVIIPVYNMSDSLEKCILSITRYQNRDIQIIIVDDGYTDNTLTICNYMASLDDRIVVIHQNNQGSGPARNNGIKVADGEYLLFIDSDDRLSNNTIETLICEIKKKKYDLFVFGYKIITPSKSVVEKKYRKKLLYGQKIRDNYSPFFNNMFVWGIQGAPWNKLFKADIVKNNGIVYPDLRRHQDEVFISRFINCVETVMFLDSVLYIHYANDTNRIWSKYPEDYYSIVNQLYIYRQKIIESWNYNNDNPLYHQLCMA